MVVRELPHGCVWPGGDAEAREGVRRVLGPWEGGLPVTWEATLGEHIAPDSDQLKAVLGLVNQEEG